MNVNVPARLALFAVLLAGAFAGAWIAGDAWGPAVESTHGVHGGMSQ